MVEEDGLVWIYENGEPIVVMSPSQYKKLKELHQE